MKRNFDQFKVNSDNIEDICNANKKKCLDHYWPNKDLSNFSNYLDLSFVDEEINKKPDYICIYHKNDKYVCSIYDCRGMKKSVGPKIFEDLSQFT